MQLDRLPAYPLVTSDPYISIWSCSDDPTDSDTRHWAGARKRLSATVRIDGTLYTLLGRCSGAPAQCVGRAIEPLTTRYCYHAGGLEVVLTFRAPLLPDDLDLLSMPVTFIEIEARVLDGGSHECISHFTLHDDICYDGEKPVPMMGDMFRDGVLSVGWMGRRRQNTLSHSGDHITIDWGYAFLASEDGISFERTQGHYALSATAALAVSDRPAAHRLLLAYDDVVSILYFGFPAQAWYKRSGKTIVDALKECYAQRAQIEQRIQAFEEQMISDARAVGGEAYGKLVCAAYRQCIAAHKLIADQSGQPVFLSKENDSNGCIGTADVSYPSIPLFLLYAPELVRGMCRPILHFASLPVWTQPYAPHDVGTYPYATGQRYAAEFPKSSSAILDDLRNGDVWIPAYLYPAENALYEHKYQMPVEESANMVLMLAAALRADGDTKLILSNLELLTHWVDYLMEYGADPAEQLCTDDFAGHLAHNVNLAMKAVCAVRAFGWILERIGREADAPRYAQAAKVMADSVLARAKRDDHTALTLDGDGWSLKYNAVWDLLFGFDLWSVDFYRGEIGHYLRVQNAYGVPLDARADYTKSDWIAWAAAMSSDAQDRAALLAPVARYLDVSPSRVPFSDWYDTKTGAYMHFIARSVQGGIFMPMLRFK